MKDRFKRVFASLLAAMMVFTFMPTLAFADDGGETPSAPQPMTYEEAVDAVAEIIKQNESLKSFYYEYYDDVERVVEAAEDLKEAIEKGKATQAELEALYENFVKAVNTYNENVKAYLSQFTFEATKNAASNFAMNVEALNDLLKTGEATKEEIAKAVAYVVKSGETVGIAAYIEMFYGYFNQITEDANSWIDGIEDEELQEVLRDFVADAVVLRNALNDYLPQAAEYIDFLAKYEDEEEVLALLNSIEAEIQKAIAAGEAAQAKFEEGTRALIEKYKEILADAEEWINNIPADGNVDFQAIIDKFMEDATALRAAIDTYLPEVLDYLADLAEKNDAAFKALMEEFKSVIEQAQAKFKEAAAALPDKLMAALEDFVFTKGMDALEYWTSDECKELLAEYGIDRDAINDLVMDILRYSQGYQKGETYTAISGELSSIKKALSNAGVEASTTKEAVDKLIEKDKESTEQIAQLQKALAEATASGSSSTEDVSKLKNALKVVNTKVSIKKPKSKKRKVTAKWNAVSGVTIDGYQVKWKVGKKTYKKTAAANATSIKSKKLKKGKKAKVQVRAFVKVNGVTYYGPWSKVKKVKVK